MNSGQVVTVSCAAIEGDSPLKLRWLLNGHEITRHSGITILDLGGRGAILSIGSVQASHAGTYTCVAENFAGRHELSADLIVNGATLRILYQSSFSISLVFLRQSFYHFISCLFINIYFHLASVNLFS